MPSIGSIIDKYNLISQADNKIYKQADNEVDDKTKKLRQAIDKFELISTPKAKPTAYISQAPEDKTKSLQKLAKGLYEQAIPYEKRTTELPAIDWREEQRRATKAGIYGAGAGLLYGGEGIFPYKEAMEYNPEPFLMANYFASNFIGKIGKFYLTGLATAPLASITAKTEFAKSLADIVPKVTPGAIGYAAARGANWFTVKALDNNIEFLMGTKKPTIANILAPVGSGIWGSTLGILHSFVDLPQVTAHIGEKTNVAVEKLFDIPDSVVYKPSILSTKMLAVGAIAGATKSTIPKLYNRFVHDKKLTIKDGLDVAATALFTGLVESLGHEQLKSRWNAEQMNQWQHDLAIYKIMQKTGFNPEEAKQYLKNVPKLVEIATKHTLKETGSELPEFVALMEKHRINPELYSNELQILQNQITQSVKNTMTVYDLNDTYMKYTTEAFWKLSNQAQNDILRDVIHDVKVNGNHFIDAWENAKSAISGAFSKENPVPEINLDKVFIEGISLKQKATKMGKYYEQELKKYGASDNEINTIKQGKSFGSGEEKSMSASEALIKANELKDFAHLYKTVEPKTQEEKDDLIKKVNTLRNLSEDVSIAGKLRGLDKALKEGFSLEQVSKIQSAEDLVTLWQRLKPDSSNKAKLNMDVKNIREDFYNNFAMFSDPLLNGEIGAEAGCFAILRPTRLVFQQCPYTYFFAFKPLHDGAVMAYNYKHKEKLEVMGKVKELKLNNEDLETVTQYRMLNYYQNIKNTELDKSLPILSRNQTKWNDFLTSKFKKYLQEFDVKSEIPPEYYLPLLFDEDIAKLEEMAQYTYPDIEDTEIEEPKKIKDISVFATKEKTPSKATYPKRYEAFFRKIREGRKTEGYRLNSLDLYLSYINAAVKDKFLSEPLRAAEKLVLTHPNVSDSMKSYIRMYEQKIMGYPTILDKGYGKVLSIITDGKINENNMYDAVNFMMDTTYMATLGLRGTKALKNLTQSLNTVYAIGPEWVALGIERFVLNGTKRAKAAGVLLDYAPELHEGKISKMRDTFMILFSTSDIVNRSIAYEASTAQFDYYWKKSKGDANWLVDKSPLRKTNKVMRAEIRNLLNQGKVEDAKNIYAADIVAKTQYLYRNMDSPIITKDILGRQVFQFQSWRENYIELLLDLRRNKNYRGLLTLMLTSFGLMASAKYFAANRKKVLAKMFKAPVGLRTLPYQDRDFDIIPPTARPIWETLKIIPTGIELAYPTNWMDNSERRKQFKKLKTKSKAAGKTLFRTYVPGAGLGLEMYDFYKYVD